ncbi:MAG: hypothetical protein Q8O24_05340 [Gallionellaceae bacterium]|nr:hypothetical protein [Gallionellaceae bacterium]
MKTYHNTKSAIIPAGKYWIGDPYHVLGLEVHQFFERAYLFDKLLDGVIREGQVFWYHTTNPGDDCYEISSNTLPNIEFSSRKFFMTKNVIGIVPFELTVESAADFSSGVIVTFPDEVELSYDDGQLSFVSGEGELVIDLMPYKYIAMGFDLSHLTPIGQAERHRYLIEQVSHFAYGLSGGYIAPAYMMNEILQLTVHSNEDPYFVYMALVAQLVSGEIDIPEDNKEALVLIYTLISNGDFDDPIYCLKEMSGDYRVLTTSFENSRSCDESLEVKLMTQANDFQKMAKEWAEKSNASDDQDRNEYIYDQCGVALMDMKVRKLETLASQAAKRAKQRVEHSKGTIVPVAEGQMLH